MLRRTHISARFPLRPDIPHDVIEDLVETVVGLTAIEADGPGDALPCRLAEDIRVSDHGLPRWTRWSVRMSGCDLLMCGAMPNFDVSLQWNVDRCTYESGTPVMAEFLAMIGPALDARPGAVLGSMGLFSTIYDGGPILMTPAGPRWCPSCTEADIAPRPGTMVKTVTRVPAFLLRPFEGGDPRCHVDVDREGLRRYAEGETMKRIRCSRRMIASS
jgi:hypothetical protein